MQYLSHLVTQVSPSELPLILNDGTQLCRHVFTIDTDCKFFKNPNYGNIAQELTLEMKLEIIHLCEVSSLSSN
jgi:hypothetical protein